MRRARALTGVSVALLRAARRRARQRRDVTARLSYRRHAHRHSFPLAASVTVATTARRRRRRRDVIARLFVMLGGAVVGRSLRLQAPAHVGVHHVTVDAARLVVEARVRAPTNHTRRRLVS